jgi:hypothetical protein
VRGVPEQLHRKAHAPSWKRALENTIKSWCPVSRDNRVLIVTDTQRLPVAQSLSGLCEESGCDTRLCVFRQTDARYSTTDIPGELLEFGPMDATFVLLSDDYYLARNGLARLFPALTRPGWLNSRYVFFRPRIPDQALLEGLCTSREVVDRIVGTYASHARGEMLCVAAPGGTDIRVVVGDFEALPYIVDSPAANCFLPPSETYAALDETSANGIIVADLTVGEFVCDGQLLEAFGRPDVPVRFVVEDGLIVAVEGGSFADSLRELLWALPVDARRVVELGIGLSAISPTGYIGADECIAGTCHFGIGDNRFYGGRNDAPIHLDVVVDRPSIGLYPL